MADPQSNPFDNAADEVMNGQSAVIRNNVYNAIPQNPAQVSEHAQLADQLNLPIQSVQADPVTAKQRAAMQNMDVQKVVTNHPHLADFMTDPVKAAQVTANGDVPNMANVEQAVKNATPNSLQDNINSISETPFNFVQGLGYTFNRAAKATNIALGAFPTVYDKAAGLITGKQVSSASDYWFSHMVDTLDRDATAFDAGPQATTLQKLVHGTGGLVGTLSQIGATGGMSEAPAAIEAAAPVVSTISNAVAHATKSMAFPSITGAINTGNEVYQTTGSTSAAVKAATAAYGTNTAMGVLPMGMSGNLATRIATGFPVGAVTGEVNRQVTNASMPGSMQQNASVEDAIINGITGSMLSGAMGHNTPLHEKAVQEAYQTARQSYDAVQGGEALTALSNAAANTQLRTNNPQAFHDFVQNVTDDGHLPEVYVDGQTLVNALHQTGIPLEELQAKMPQLSSQLQEALHTNGDVKIDTADYATSIAGTPLDAAILPHLKTDPEGMTYAQGQEHLANQQAEMEAQAKDVVSKQQEQSERDAQLAAITADTKQQFDATGRFPSAVTARYAELRSRFIDTQSKAMGVSPEELNRMMPLKVTGDSLAMEGLNQGEKLSPDHQAIETAAHQRVDQHADQMADEYLQKNGNLIDPDRVKEMFPAYAKDNSLANAVHEPSSRLSKIIYAKALEKNAGKPVTFTAGGGGSGKSEAMERTSDALGLDRNSLVMDSTLSNFDSAKGRIDQALESGSPVDIVYTNRHVNDAFKFAMGRDRVVPLEVLAKAHVGASDTIRQLAEHYASNPAVRIHVANNMGKLAEIHQGKLADVPKYDYNQVEGNLHEIANEAHDSGTIDDAKYNALTSGTGLGRGDSQVHRETQGQDLGSTGGRAGSGSESPDDSVSQDLSQGNRGFYNPATGELGILKNADLSTALHELGHHFLEAIHTLAEHPNAPEGIKTDFDTLLKHFNVEGATPEDRLLDWSTRTLEDKRDGHERFAEDFEKYLFDGKAPVPELQSMFSRFRSWLMNVYGSLKGNLSPEVQGVFDRMFASQEAINEAERARGYLMPDLSAEHGEMIDQYKTLGKEATEQAIADMQARSLRDMKWLSNAKSKAIRNLQRQAATERATIREEVTKEVMETPVNKARTFLTMGETHDQDGNLIKAEKGFKLNTNDLRQMFPKESLTPLDLNELRGMTSEDGLHPDLVAEIFGFDSGKTLVGALTHGEKPADQIKGMTDQRMLERHGELTDPVSIERAAEAAIHNEARAKMMATGLKMFAKSPMSVNEINKAAKAAADTAINAKNVGDVRPAQYSAAESKANKEMLKLAPKDPQGAAAAQRAALLNNRLFKSASEAVTDVQKGLQYLKRFSRDSVRAKIDVDIRDQIDDILSRFDLRKNPTNEPTRPQRNLQDWVDSQVQAGLMPSVTPEMLQPEFRKPYREMTMEQFRGMVDTIKSLEETGKNRNSIMINGEKADLNDYVNQQLIPKIQLAGENFSPEELYSRPEDRGIGKFQIGLDHAMSWLRGVGAELKPQEFKRNFFDRHEIMGPFGESIFEPVMKANYDKVDKLKAMSDSFRAKADELGKDWQKSLDDMVENNTLIDKIVSDQSGQPTMMKISRGRMIMMALHAGNESNFNKLTKGYGWEGADVWKFLDANMSAKDIDAVNHIHQMYETHWPDMVKMYRELGQTEPPKIEARPTDLQNGRLTGGYAHIDYDPLRSRYGQKAGEGQAKEIAEKGVSVGDYFKRTGTTNGAMNARIEGYTDAINLDFHTIEQALKETIHDLAYRRALVDTNKILEHPDFKREFQAAYGPENLQALHTWLGRIANSNNADLNASKLAHFLQYSRTGIVINGIAFRATTVLKHGGSAAIKTIGYMAGGGEKYFGSRFAAMFHDYSNQTQSAIAKFDEIRARSMQQDRDYRQTASSLFEPESLMSKGERFGHAAVAFSDLFTAVPTAWAAYDRAVTEGIPVRQGGTGQPMTEAQAVAYANKMVREAHGSNIESARSNVMTEPKEAIKMFTTLYGFMNNTYGQQADVLSKLHTPGISKPEVLARTFMALIVPALWAGYLSDQKKEGDSWAGWVAKAITNEQAGSVPFVRDAAALVEGKMGAGQVAVESWMATMVKAAHDAYQIEQGKGEKAHVIQDAGNALGEGLHIPGLGQGGKTAQYIVDRHTGKQPAPAGTVRDNDLVNAVIGAPKK